MLIYTLEVFTKYEGSHLVGIYANLEALERGKQAYLDTLFLSRLSSDQRFVVDTQEVQQ